MRKQEPRERRTERRDDRPRRTFGDKRQETRDEGRPARRPFNRDNEDRPRRPFNREGGEDRPRRPFNREGGDDRPRRTFSRDGEDRPRRPFNREGGDDRPRRPFNRDNEDRPRRPFNREGGDDRPRRPFNREGGEDRPRRSFTRHSSPVTRHSEDDRPRRTFRKDSDDKPRRPKTTKKSTDEIRLNRFLANSGICSRREADEYIVAGLVTVNGEVVTEMGVRVKATDDIRFNGERMKGEQKVYIVMNKPKDYVTTMGDPYAEDTVMDLIGDKCPQRVYPIGRLDKSTTGVLLFTNDGELAEQLTHPSYNKKKIYHVFLDKNLKAPDFQQLLDGVKLEDGETHADSLSYIDEDNSQVGLEIHSGRNRVVRRMFEALGYRVQKLDRVYFAGITKKNLKRGQWRFLTEQEVTMLKMGAYD